MKELKDIIGKSIALPTRTEILEDSPLPKGDICPTCGGRGFVRRNVKPADPDFGLAFACQCQDNIIWERWVARFPKHRNFGDLTSKSFQHEALRAALTWASCTGPAWLVLQGNNGTGKTHIAIAAMLGRGAHDRRQRGTYWKTADLMDYLRDEFREGVDEARYRLVGLQKMVAPLLIDDLGKEKMTEWVAEKLFQILDYRYEHELPTVLTSNKDLADFDASLASRIADRRVVSRVLLVGSDFRREHEGRA